MVLFPQEDIDLPQWEVQPWAAIYVSPEASSREVLVKNILSIFPTTE